MTVKKTNKEKPAPNVATVQTEWSVLVLNPPPQTVSVGGRRINDRQIITLPDDQSYLDALVKAGYRFRQEKIR